MHRIADCGGRTPVEQMWRPRYERYAPQGGDLGAGPLGAHINMPEDARRCPKMPEDVAKVLNSLRAATVVA